MPHKRPHYAFSLFSSSNLELSDCLTETITDSNQLNANKDLMKCKMEAFVTNLQGQIIKKLQEFEPESKFIVDRWTRKEGGGGRNFAFLFQILHLIPK
jgi:hypothetical protein